MSIPSQTHVSALYDLFQREAVGECIYEVYRNNEITGQKLFILLSSSFSVFNFVVFLDIFISIYK